MDSFIGAVWNVLCRSYKISVSSMSIVLHSSLSLSSPEGLTGIFEPPAWWAVQLGAIHESRVLWKEPTEGMLARPWVTAEQIVLARHHILASNPLWSSFQRGWTLLFPAVLPGLAGTGWAWGTCPVPDGLSLLQLHHHTPDVQEAAKSCPRWAKVPSSKKKVSLDK